MATKEKTMPKTIKFSVNTSIEIKEIEVKYPHIIKKILPELRKENKKCYRKWEDKFFGMAITKFLDYLEEKYGKQNTK